MEDPRKYNEQGDVIGNYLSPGDIQERYPGLEFHGRPNEPAPYLTEDEARGLGQQYKPQSAFPQYNYSGRTPSGPTPPRTRANNPMEDLMKTIRQMNQTPGGWQSGQFQQPRSIPTPPPRSSPAFPPMSDLAQAQTDFRPVPSGNQPFTGGWETTGPATEILPTEWPSPAGGGFGPNGWEPARPPGTPANYVYLGQGWDGQPVFGPPEMQGKILF